jgi:hypothetical protein
VGQTSVEVGAKLEEWFAAVGKQLVFSSAIDHLPPDGDEHAADDGSEDEAHSDESKADGAADVAEKTRPLHTLQSLDFEAEQVDEIEKLVNQETAIPVPDDDDPSLSPQPFFSPPKQPQGGEHESKRPRLSDDPKQAKTLYEILERCDLIDFWPDEGDSLQKSLERIRKLCPSFQEFVSQVRIAERFLRPGQVVEGKRALSKHAELLKQISKAQRSFCSAGSRQSRATAWMYFSKLVAEVAAGPAVLTASDPEAVSCAITHFRPSVVLVASTASGPEAVSCAITHSSQRDYQVVAVRLHPCGVVMLGLVEALCRGSYNAKRKAVGSRNYEGTLEAQYCTIVHLCLFDVDEHDAGVDGLLFHASSKSQPVVVDPHNETGVILYEIPKAQYTLQETDIFLLLRLSKAAHQGMTKVTGTGLVPTSGKAVKSPAAGDAGDAVFTYDCFTCTKSGRAKIENYMQVMRRLYEVLVGDTLVDKDGHVMALQDKQGAACHGFFRNP